MPRRWVVVGAGAVGGSLGGLLAEAGERVALVARGAHGDLVRRDGLRLRLPERDLSVRLSCVARMDAFDWNGDDVALVATKLGDAREALDGLRAAAGPGLPVVCATNGVHAERWAAERFDDVVSMLVWLPAVHLEPGEVRLHSGRPRGVLDCGAHKGPRAAALAEALCARLVAAGFDAVPRADLASWKRAKWIANLGGAAQALVREGWREVAAAAQAEGERVLDAAGLARVPTAALRERVAHVRELAIDGTPRPGNSTWQSRARGRPLESAWIEGALVELAAEVGVPAPVNARLAEAARSARPLTAETALGLG